MLDIEVEETAACTICRPRGELDAFSVGRLRERLGALVAADRLVIDLSEVPFLDSAGIGALIGAIRKTREHGGSVAVACSRTNLLRLLQTTMFDRIVPVRPTLDDAIAATGQPQD